MPAPAARTILLIHPPPATLPTPPIMLTQVTAFLSTISKTNHRWDASNDESNGIGSVLPTLLERLSVNHQTGY
ncbi:MAG: hypothetical protein WBY88_05885, partial [Desulfosarcina sp.]